MLIFIKYGNNKEMIINSNCRVNKIVFNLKIKFLILKPLFYQKSKDFQFF